MKNGKLDPRVVRTRELLRNSLVDLIPTKGFNDLSIQEITDHARLNRATFYLHYKDKDELLLDVFDEVVVSSIPQPPPPDAPLVPLSELHPVVTVLTHIAEHASFYHAILGEQGVPLFMARVQGYIEDLVRRWFLVFIQEDTHPDDQWDIVINYLGAAYLGVINWWLAHDMPYTPQEMENQLLLLTTRGVNGLVEKFDRPV